MTIFHSDAHFFDFLMLFDQKIRAVKKKRCPYLKHYWKTS